MTIVLVIEYIFSHLHLFRSLFFDGENQNPRTNMKIISYIERSLLLEITHVEISNSLQNIIIIE